MMTKLMQEAVTEVASCGVMNLPTTWIFLMGSLMMLAKAAYTASLYAMTPMIQATIREICGRAHTHTRKAADGEEHYSPCITVYSNITHAHRNIQLPRIKRWPLRGRSEHTCWWQGGTAPFPKRSVSFIVFSTGSKSISVQHRVQSFSHICVILFELTVWSTLVILLSLLLVHRISNSGRIWSCCCSSSKSTKSHSYSSRAWRRFQNSKNRVTAKQGLRKGNVVNSSAWESPLLNRRIMRTLPKLTKNRVSVFSLRWVACFSCSITLLDFSVLSSRPTA